ncbi:MAG: dienelactone hydrolase family protein, partial [Candidatus Methylomirabilia bacterium]
QHHAMEGVMELRTDRVTLAVPDGSMPAYLCRPATGGPFPGVIVVMEAFGLNSHIQDVAERIAREGYVSMAPDLYHRFGSPIIPYEDIPKAVDYLQKLEDPEVMAEIGAAIGYLKGLKEVRADRLGITGFCMGGRVTFLAACRHASDIKAAVPFYGGGIAAEGPNAPVNFAREIQCPILCFFGETDALIPLDQVRKTEETLKQHGKTFEVKVYSGAGHGFFCNERASYHPEAARDAWEKTKGWFGKYLKP